MPVSPPRPKGPPLNALRAFEAAARLGGFGVAAEELSVTPGAISQHIKVLEAWVGAPLFKRRSQGVTLTERGAQALDLFSAAFDALGNATRQLKQGSQRDVITIATLPSVGQLWLTPRLPGIRAALPGLVLSIVAIEQRPNLAREMFDMALFLDVPTGRNGETVLRQDALFPVCAPKIASNLQGPKGLRDQIRLTDASWPNDWTRWAELAAPELLPLVPGPSYSLYSFAVDEAQNGAGVLIGHSALVGDRLQSGVLVDPFALAVPSGLSLNLEVPDPLPKGPVSKLAGLLIDLAA